MIIKDKLTGDSRGFVEMPNKERVKRRAVARTGHSALFYFWRDSVRVPSGDMYLRYASPFFPPFFICSFARRNPEEHWCLDSWLPATGGRCSFRDERGCFRARRPGPEADRNKEILIYAVVDRIIRYLKLTFAAEKPPPSKVFEEVARLAAEERGEYE
jgi:hypothetical protein